MSDHEMIRDQAAIRASWDGDCPDVTRIVRRVGAAMNSGRDAAVVDVVLDETQAARDEADTLRTHLAALIKSWDDHIAYEPCTDCLKSGVALWEYASDEVMDSAIESARTALGQS